MRTGRVVVVGAGHVGMIAAMRLADADEFDEVVLVDIDRGRAAGVALDLAHTAALSGFATRVRGVGTVEEAGPADYVVITAGRPRQPGMSRADLISTNARIVGDVAGRVAAISPHAVLVVVTNPLDEMTQHAWAVSGFPARRVVGMAGVLDTARFQALAALSGAGRADRITAWALGSHGEEMVIPLSRADVDGRPLTERLPAGELDAVVDRARGSGAEVVGLAQDGERVPGARHVRRPDGAGHGPGHRRGDAGRGARRGPVRHQRCVRGVAGATGPRRSHRDHRTGPASARTGRAAPGRRPHPGAAGRVRGGIVTGPAPGRRDR